MNPFGFNILSSDPALWSLLDRSLRSTLLFMNDWAGAKQAQTRYPTCKVIHRVFSSEEDTMHRTPNRTLAHLQARASERQHNSVYINLACEPQIPTDDDLRKLNDEQLKALVWAKANGVRVAALHLAHYGIDGSRWQLIEPVMNMIADNPDLFLLGVDEYAAGHMFSGVVDPSVGDNQIGHIQPETWKRSPIPKYWHCGRITDYFRDRQARGLPLPLTVITEHGLDALGDVTAWRNSLLRTAGYDDIRGWRSLRVQHEAWYGLRGWSAERAYAEMLAACWREIYAPFPNIVGACIYCYGTNGDAQWNQFRVDGANELLTRLEAGEDTVANLPKPTGMPVHARLKTLPAGATYRNIRGTLTDAGQAGADVGDLIIGDEVFYFPATSATFNYHYVRQVKTNIEGWVLAAPSVTFEAIVDEPADCTELEIQIGVLTAQLTGLQATNAALSDMNTTLQADKLALQLQVDNFRLLLSGIKGLAQDIHEQAGHLYNTIDGAIESTEAPPT